MLRLSDWTFDDHSPLERFRRWRKRLARRPVAEIYSDALWSVLLVLAKVAVGLVCAAILGAVAFGLWLAVTGP